ncbi:unnamed protein product [Sphacelaria rigidula]
MIDFEGMCHYPSSRPALKMHFQSFAESTLQMFSLPNKSPTTTVNPTRVSMKMKMRVFEKCGKYGNDNNREINIQPVPRICSESRFRFVGAFELCQEPRRHRNSGHVSCFLLLLCHSLYPHNPQSTTHGDEENQLSYFAYRHTCWSSMFSGKQS